MATSHIVPPEARFGFTAAGEVIRNVSEFDLAESGAPFIACLVMLKLEGLADHPQGLPEPETELLDGHIGEILTAKFPTLVHRLGTIGQPGVRAFWNALMREGQFYSFVENKLRRRPSNRLITICAGYIKSEQFTLNQSADVTREGLHNSWINLLEGGYPWAFEVGNLDQLGDIFWEGDINKELRAAKRNSYLSAYIK